MRKTLLLITLGLVFNSNVIAHKVIGQIFLSNDTINVTFRIPTNGFSGKINYAKLQRNVKYIDSSGKQVKLNPDIATEIRFRFKGKSIRMISVPRKGWNSGISLTNDNIFLRIVIDGNVKMFIYYYNVPIPVNSNGSAIGTEGDYLLRKGDELLKCIENIKFESIVKEYFSDCSDLVAKINEREMNRDYLEWIINFYNKNCGKK